MASEFCLQIALNLAKSNFFESPYAPPPPLLVKCFSSSSVADIRTRAYTLLQNPLVAL